MDSGTDGGFFVITQAGRASVGEDVLELAPGVTKAVVVIGVGACICCAPIMVASL